MKRVHGGQVGWTVANNTRAKTTCPPYKAATRLLQGMVGNRQSFYVEEVGLGLVAHPTKNA
jgi:hypothetical protein